VRRRCAVGNSQQRVLVRHQDVVSVGKLSLGQERYYLEQAQDRVDAAESLTGAEDYYVGGGESPGRWCGSAAAELRLAGVVDAEQLRRLLAGAHPRTGGQLREASPRLKVAAFDVTFSAPKSVSVLFGTCRRDRSSCRSGPRH
jgi:conjugative relaxase-like TrwC/TraI family protein